MEKRKLKVLRLNQTGGSHIRLRGQWLNSAGFHPGMWVKVSVKSPGVMEIRVVDAAQLFAADFTAAVAPFTKLGL
jgi:hypothetical protein